MVVEQHLQVHVNIDGDKCVATRIDSHKVIAAQHDLRVVNDEAAEHKDPVKRVPDEEDVRLGEERHRNHAAEKGESQSKIQNLPTDRVVHVRLEGVPGEYHSQAHCGYNRLHLHGRLILQSGCCCAGTRAEGQQQEK